MGYGPIVAGQFKSAGRPQSPSARICRGYDHRMANTSEQVREAAMMMDDLRHNQAVLRELMAHHVQREGNYRWFYRDNQPEGWVTIGVGCLVKTKDDARKLPTISGVTFHTVQNTIAGADHITEDWERVHSHPKLKADAYKSVAKLRLDEGGVFALYRHKIEQMANQLYKSKPFIMYYDARVAASFVDVLYNPAGVPLFGHRHDINEMWMYLNPIHPKFDPYQGWRLFRKIWISRGGHNQKRYAERHEQRASMLFRGIARTPLPGEYRLHLSSPYLRDTF
jgi:hypothetical protein